ncbi:unnamed protein product [Thelazia callipaeda]|uniref:Glyco_hydro_35 domain-containing protein n=1 Tax=Thelazia callipaeda TaxID=103827 RepID=A0A158RCY8_THECL|nr:unnamed protein product [Thelazia callipaeda]
MNPFWLMIIIVFIFNQQLISSQSIQLSNRTFAIDYKNNMFLLDGSPFRYIAGSIHYFRIHPDYWDDRMQRVRAAGLNAIQTYIPWNFHEVRKAKYLFSGQRNITHFFELAMSNQFFYLRIGPYICAEWENGGLPWWLLRDYRDINQRSSDLRYKKEVQNWFGKLLPIIHPYLFKNGGPILMIQAENEYGSNANCDHGYMQWLTDLIRHHLGAETIQYTSKS